MREGRRGALVEHRREVLKRDGARGVDSIRDLPGHPSPLVSSERLPLGGMVELQHRIPGFGHTPGFGHIPGFGRLDYQIPPAALHGQLDSKNKYVRTLGCARIVLYPQKHSLVDRDPEGTPEVPPLGPPTRLCARRFAAGL